jgi:hypothetical protein
MIHYLLRYSGSKKYCVCTVEEFSLQSSCERETKNSDSNFVFRGNFAFLIVYSIDCSPLRTVGINILKVLTHTSVLEFILIVPSQTFGSQLGFYSANGVHRVSVFLRETISSSFPKNYILILS